MEESYITKYARAREITEAEAVTHKMVKEYIKYADTVRNAVGRDHTDKNSDKPACDS